MSEGTAAVNEGTKMAEEQEEVTTSSEPTESTAEGATMTPTTTTMTPPPPLTHLDQIQSLFCAVLDPFTKGLVEEPQEPPAPAGFMQDGILRNGASKPGEELLQYTSAGESITTLYQSFEFGAQRQPDAPCLGKRPSATAPSYEWVSYASVRTDAEKIGSYLKDLGVEPGQRIGLSGKNAPEYLTAIQGCFWAGATAVRMECFVELCVVLYGRFLTFSF